MPALLIALLLSSSIDRELFRRVLRRANPDLKLCYRDALQLTPDLRGKVVSVLVINSSGGIDSVEVGWQGTPDAPPAFRTCVQNALMKVKFPPSRAMPSDGTIKVTWPVVFQPETTPAAPR
ncbi:MAG: AgmX/PglI C-terminal domain-containing protein [Myxococcaceae bacterium]